MGWKIVAKIMLALILAYITSWAWPYKVERITYEPVNKSAENYSYEVWAKLNGHNTLEKNWLYKTYIYESGSLMVRFRVNTPLNQYKSLNLISKEFKPEINIKRCLSNSPTQYKQYCQTDNKQEFYKHQRGKQKSGDWWLVGHVIDRKKSFEEFEDIEFLYQLELCFSNQNCQSVAEEGQLKLIKSVVWRSPLFGEVEDDGLMVPLLILILAAQLLLIISMLAQAKADKSARAWLAATILALLTSPVFAFCLAWLLTLNVSDLEGGRGYAALYLFLLLTPILFVIILLSAKKWIFARKQSKEKS